MKTLEEVIKDKAILTSLIKHINFTSVRDSYLNKIEFCTYVLLKMFYLMTIKIYMFFFFNHLFTIYKVLIIKLSSHQVTHY